MFDVKPLFDTDSTTKILPISHDKKGGVLEDRRYRSFKIGKTPIPSDTQKKWIPLNLHPQGGIEWWDIAVSPPDRMEWDDLTDAVFFRESFQTCCDLAAKTPASDWVTAKKLSDDLDAFSAAARGFYYASQVTCLEDVVIENEAVIHPSHTNLIFRDQDGVRTINASALFAEYQLFDYLWAVRSQQVENFIKGMSVECAERCSEIGVTAGLQDLSLKLGRGLPRLAKASGELFSEVVTVQVEGVMEDLSIQGLSDALTLQSSLGLSPEFAIHVARTSEQIIAEVGICGVAKVNHRGQALHVLTKKEEAWDYTG